MRDGDEGWGEGWGVECGVCNVECGLRVNFGFRPFRPVEVVLENGFEK